MSITLIAWSIIGLSWFWFWKSCWMLKFAQLSVNDIHLQTDVNYSHSLRKRLHSQHPQIQSRPCLYVQLLKHCLVEKADVTHKIKSKELIGFMYIVCLGQGLSHNSYTLIFILSLITNTLFTVNSVFHVYKLLHLRLYWKYFHKLTLLAQLYFKNMIIKILSCPWNIYSALRGNGGGDRLSNGALFNL